MDWKRFGDDMGEIKKGPWKAEEDEVLINHVKKYGPRDWSSIRSKALLQRTGKSCRLRWVNKLRPNLKNGVKFSAEEERLVIDLQAQFGNKWAKVATYLPGRTDNDVKNFWSSRQKRLARILQTPASSSNKSQKNKKHVPVIHEVLSAEAPKFSSLAEEESLCKSQSCSSSYIGNSNTIRMVPLQELMHPNSLHYELSSFQPEFICSDKKPCIETLAQFSFPSIPLQSEFTLPLENQELAGLEDSNYLEVFGRANSSELGNMQLPIISTCFGSESSTQIAGRKENDNPVTPDIFMDDFPVDMFDHIDRLPSPPDW